MTTTMPAVEVRGPALAPYPFGLFAAVTPTPADADKGAAGVWWTSEACAAAGVTYSPCNVDVPDPINALAPNVVCGVNESSVSFTVYAYSDQSVGGRDLAEQFARASTLLQAGEQAVVEAQLWAALTAAATPGTGGTGTLATLAQAEQAATSVYGGTPTVHVSRYHATLLHEALHAEGGRLRTVLGSDVVAGAGYDHTDALIFVTGPVVVVRGPILNLGQHVDRTENTVSAVVERTYTLGWDCFASSHAIA